VSTFLNNLCDVTFGVSLDVISKALNVRRKKTFFFLVATGLLN